MAFPLASQLALVARRAQDPATRSMLSRGFSPSGPTASMPAVPAPFAGYATGPQAMHAYDQTINHDLNYDASDALNRYAQGAWGSVSEGLKQVLADTRGKSVGAGRFDSGYLDEDQGMVIRQTANDFSNNIAQQAMNAAGLQQDVYGRGEENLAGRAEQIVNDEREQAARKRKKKRGIFGAIGSIVGGAGGFLLGGPAGAAAGAKVGGSIGGAF